jgi:small nuclear ribonucleoprotein (snRNP)-like protein
LQKQRNLSLVCFIFLCTRFEDFEVKMQEYGGAKEKFNFYNHLTSIVKALENKHTVIDLRNEGCVSGLIKFVDGFMNIEMENVVFFNPRGRAYKFNNFFISTRNIRYVHIPDGLSAIELLQKQMDKMQHSNVKPKKKITFKTARAKRYQKAILESLNEPTPGPSST